MLRPISRFVEVGPQGKISALTESHVDFSGAKTREPTTIGFITFKGTKGGLIHKVSGAKLKIGASVRPKFLPEKERNGPLLDIVAFEVV